MLVEAGAFSSPFYESRLRTYSYPLSSVPPSIRFHFLWASSLTLDIEFQPVSWLLVLVWGMCYVDALFGKKSSRFSQDKIFYSRIVGIGNDRAGGEEGILMLSHPVIMRPLTSHLFKAGAEYAEFTSD